MITALDKRPLILLPLLFLFAFGVRMIYLHELPQNPYFDYVSPAFDHYNLDQSAINFAKGDLLARAPNNSFAPLYKYFLGIIYWLFGRNFYVIYSIQFAMGALASVLIFSITRDLFGARAGIFAFLGFSLHTTEIIYEGIILREAFIAFWGVVSFYFLSRLATDQRANANIVSTVKGLIPAALALSLFIQGRPNTILCLPFVCFFLHKYVFCVLEGRAKAKAWLVFSGTFLGSLIPLLIQCYLVHGRFVFFDSSGPHTFLSGNLIGYTGVGFDSNLIGNYQKKHDLGYAANIQFLFHHIAENPFEFLKMYLRKIYFFFNDFETPTNISVYLYREFSGFLPRLLNHFAIFSSLGLVGIVLAVKNRKDAFLLYAYAFSMALGVVLFLIEDRYRLPAVPYYIIFSAYTIDTIFAKVECRQYRDALLTALACVILFFSFLETKGLVRIREQDYNNIAGGYQARNDLEKANEYLERALRINPMGTMTFHNKGLYHYHKKEWSMAVFYFEHLIQTSDDQSVKTIKGFFIHSLSMLGQEEMARKNYESAAAWYEKALLYDPDSVSNLTHLGICYFGMDKREEAKTQISKALGLDPGYAPARRIMDILEGR